MSARRYGRTVTALGAGVLGLVSALVAAWLTGGSSASFQARAQVAVVPTPERSPGQALAFWSSEVNPQELRIMLKVLQLPRTQALAAEAAGVPAGGITVTTAVVERTNLIDVTVDAPTEAAAGAALGSVLDQARTTYPRVAGLVTVETTQPMTVGAQDENETFLPVLAIATLAGLLAGGLLVHLVVAAPGRRRDVTDPLRG